MKTFYLLIFFFFVCCLGSLWHMDLWDQTTNHALPLSRRLHKRELDGKDPNNSTIPVFNGTERKHFFEIFEFNSSARFAVLCRDECRGEDLLIQTAGKIGLSGRYCIHSLKPATRQHPSAIILTIRSLTKSDSGRYRVGFISKSHQVPALVFEIRVEDAPATESPNTTVHPVPATTRSTPAPGCSPKVRLILVIVSVGSLSAVMIFVWRKTSQPKEPDEEPDHFIEMNRVYEVTEDVREEAREEDKWSRSLRKLFTV